MVGFDIVLAEKTPSWQVHPHPHPQDISRLLSVLEQIATTLGGILPYVWHFAKALLNINDMHIMLGNQ